MARRLRSTLLLALAGILLVATPVLAYLYRAPVAITENSSTAYTMLPILWDQNNTWLASNGFMSSSGNDTRVQSLGGLNYPHLVADNKTLVAIPVLADSQTNLYFVTGESASTMDIIVGYGGYVTTLDHADLELGANFTIEMDGYFNTTAGASKYLIYKTAAIEVYVSSTVSGNITASVPFTGESYIVNDDASSTYSNLPDRWLGQTFTPAVSGYMTSADVRIHTAGTLTTMQVRTTAAGLPTATVLGSGTFDSTGLGASPGSFQTISLTAPVYLTAGTVYAITLHDSTNGPNWRFDATGAAYAGGNAKWTNDNITWNDFGANQDFMFSIGMAVIVSTTGVSTGEHTITVAADSTNMTLTVDEVLADSVALGAVSVPSNANNYVSAETDTTAYLEYLQIRVGGNLRLWYQPTSYIVGTTLPDRAGTAQNGVITWGANPAGVGVTLGSMVSSGQPSIGSTATTSTSEILPVAGGTDWRPIPGVSATLQANPLRSIVTTISDTTTLSEYQVWVWLGIAFVAFITVLVGSKVRGHHLITGVAASAAIVLMVVWTIFPALTLAICILAIWSGLVSERSHSL